MIRYWVNIYITQEEGLRSPEARRYVTGIGYVIEETNMIISLNNHELYYGFQAFSSATSSQLVCNVTSKGINIMMKFLKASNVCSS